MVVPDRGRWGQFLVQQRETRGWTQEEAFGALREGLGLGPKSRSSYVNLERGGRQPDAEQQAFLVDFYQAEPPERAPVPAADQAALIAALNRQAAATESLIALIAARELVDDPEAREWAMEQIRALAGTTTRRTDGHEPAGLER